MGFIINPYNFAVAGVGGWVELGRTTLGSAGDAIDVSSLANKRYYMVLQQTLRTGSNAVEVSSRVNSDTGTSYSSSQSVNGGSDFSNTSRDVGFEYEDGTSYDSNFSVHYIANTETQEKLGIHYWVSDGGAGASLAPVRVESVGKWANTSNQITSWNTHNRASGDMAIGSEVVVLGWDPTDTHTDNFWEELASVTSTGAGTSISSGTITAKKYLWVQMYAPSGQSAINENFKWQFNGDTGNNYNRRYSNDGGTDGTTTSQDDFQSSRSGVNGDSNNVFIINNSANEKLIICHAVRIVTLGAGSAPSRQEVVGKWTNTSAQITSINISTDPDSIPAGWAMKVWGSD